jgi:hypothetical protein
MVLGTVAAVEEKIRRDRQLLVVFLILSISLLLFVPTVLGIQKGKENQRSEWMFGFL